MLSYFGEQVPKVLLMAQSSFSEDFENADQRKIRVVDEQNNWFIKQDNDGNAMYCNKATNNWTDFMLGSANWTNYSISYKVKLSSKKQGH